MRINKYWALNDRSWPRQIAWLPATKEIFDLVCIIHYPSIKNFTPIVLTKSAIKSGEYWRIESFYKGVCELLTNGSTEEGYSGHCHSIFAHYKYKWGCRIFTKAQLKLIKKEMECFYSEKQLGVKK